MSTKYGIDGNARLMWGILGAGRIAEAFARGVAASGTGQMAAVGSRDLAKAEKFARAFGVARAHGSYEALLADTGVQAVYIATPHPMHAEWAIRAAQAGKHILCEKPLTLNYGQAMAVMAAAEEAGVFLMEAFMYRCHPQTAKILEVIRSGLIGEVHVIQGSFGFGSGGVCDPASRTFNNDLGGGGILDVGCYPVSMARLVAGAAVGKDFADPLEVRGSAHLGETGVDEWAAAVMKFPGGIVAEVSTGVRQTLENGVRIFGSAGSIVIPNPWGCNRLNAETLSFMVKLNKEKEPRTVTAEAAVTSYSLEADHFAASLAAGRREALPPAMTWADTLGNMKALDAWRDSAGLVYNQEKAPAPVRGRPLAVRADAPMRYGKIPGVEKNVSRLVMGVDHPRTLTYAAALFDDYFERGGNCFDSAWVYASGLAEKVLGQWVKLRNVREQVVILDKGAHTPHCNPDALLRQFNESLDRLQMDYVDIYMMHRDNPAVPIGEFVDLLNRLHREGRVRSFGGSNWTLGRVKEFSDYAAKHGLKSFSAVSNQFSLARLVEPPWAGCLSAFGPEWREWLEESGTVLMPWSSQARGFFLPGKAKPEDRSDAELVKCWYADDNFQRLARANELAARRGVPAIVIALAYVLQQPFPTFPLIGPRLPSETRSSLQALAVELTADERRGLNLED